MILDRCGNDGEPGHPALFSKPSGVLEQHITKIAEAGTRGYIIEPTDI